MKRIELDNIQSIKIMVDAGCTVYAGNDAYRVIKDSIGQYLIKCDINDHCIGLHGLEGTKYEHQLNMTPVYINEDSPV